MIDAPKYRLATPSLEVVEDEAPRPDPTYLDQFTAAQLLAEVERRRREAGRRVDYAHVVAGDRSQFHHVYGPVVAEALGIPRIRTRYVRGRRDIVGLDAPCIVLSGSYRDRADWPDLAGELGIRRARILCLPEVWEHEAAIASLRAQARVLGLPVPEGR